MRFLLAGGIALMLPILASQTAQAAFVTAKLTGIGPGQNLAGVGYAVEIRWEQTAATGQPVPWLDPTFATFCIERTAHVSVLGVYEFNTRSLENSPDSSPAKVMSGIQADQIRRLWAAHRGGLGAGNFANALLHNMANAAFQETIWKLLDENFGVDAKPSIARHRISRGR